MPQSPPTTTRAVRFDARGAPGVLELRTVPAPTPRAGDRPGLRCEG